MKAKMSRGTRTEVAIHIIIVCIIFFLPELLQQYGRPHRSGFWAMWPYLKALMYVAVFYINYIFIINRTLFAKRRRIWLFFALNLLLVALVFFSNYLMQRYWMMQFNNPAPWHKELPAHVLMMRNWAFYLRDLAMVVLTVALSVSMKFARKWASIEKKHQQMLSSQRSAELENLKAQLNPHFLFNTLNTIYSLIEISPKEAQDAVHKLSKLLRYMLYENPGEVRLSQEIDFARTYISLMEMRIGQGVVRADFSGAAEHDVMVAPLLLFTLVENACKHGNTGTPDAKIEIKAVSDTDGSVAFTTRNHFLPVKEDSKKNSGIGLANLRRRLSLLYGDRATLTSNTLGDVVEYKVIIKSNSE